VRAPGTAARECECDSGLGGKRRAARELPISLQLTLVLPDLDALAAVYLTDLVAGPTLFVVAFTLGASWWVDCLRPAIPNYRGSGK